MTGGPRYAILVSRFPKLTETFILQELRGLEERGLDFELYSLIRESVEHLQPDAVDLDARANYLSLRDPSTWTAQLWWLCHHPIKYLSGWWEALAVSSRSAASLVRAPMIVILAAAMARRMAEQRIERVHAHWSSYPTLAALVVKRLTDVPYSFTSHASDIVLDANALGAKVRGADLVLTCTEFGRAELAFRGGRDDPTSVVLVHHGVRLDRFAVEPLPPRSDGETLRILCVAALEEYKGHRYLIDACRILVDRGVDANVELIGDGSIRDELESQVAAIGLSDRVTFGGRLSSDEVRSAITRCDVFAIGSIQLSNGVMDGIPNVLVEAMAMGRPVVASGLIGIRELIIDGETGLISEPRDAASMADALERIAGDPGLAERLALSGRTKVEAEHNAATNLDEVYRQLSSLPTS